MIIGSLSGGWKQLTYCTVSVLSCTSNRKWIWYFNHVHLCLSY